MLLLYFGLSLIEYLFSDWCVYFLIHVQLSQTSSRLSHPEIYQEGLQKEIAQLRSECRRLRMQSHQLSEENYHLKEDLWDLKMQPECLLERKHVLTLDRKWKLNILVNIAWYCNHIYFTLLL